MRQEGKLSCSRYTHAQKSGVVTIGGMLRLTGARLNTVKKCLAGSVEHKHLVRHGTGKGTWYALCGFGTKGSEAR